MIPWFLPVIEHFSKILSKPSPQSRNNSNFQNSTFWNYIFLLNLLVLSFFIKQGLSSCQTRTDWNVLMSHVRVYGDANRVFFDSCSRVCIYISIRLKKFETDPPLLKSILFATFFCFIFGKSFKNWPETRENQVIITFKKTGQFFLGNNL